MKVFGICCLLFSLTGTAAWLTLAAPANTPADELAVESLLPRQAVVLFVSDGSQSHQPAISETAAWQSLEATGLNTRLQEVLQTVLNTLQPEVGDTVRRTLESALQEGLSLAVSISADETTVSPYGVLVLHQAAELLPELQQLLSTADRQLADQIQQTTVQGRTVSQLQPDPNVTIAWWAEGPHLVIAAGIDPVAQVLATVSGQRPNVTTHPQWQPLRSAEEFQVDQLGWLDAEQLLQQFGDQNLPELPGDRQVTVRQLVDALGLAELSSVTWQSGYSGRETWQKLQVNAPGPRHGLLALLDQRTITLEELPPMPANTDGFFATSFDIRSAVDETLKTVRSVVDVIDPTQQAELDRNLAQFREMLGGEPRDVLSAGLGDLFCVYSDPAGMPISFGFSPVLSASVKDRTQLVDTIDRLVQLAQSLPGTADLQMLRSERDGHTYFSFPVPAAPLVPTVMVTDDWIVAGLTPAAAQSFARRLESGQPSWQPAGEVAAALAELPDSYTSISVSDPAPGYQQMMTFAPLGISLLESRGLPAMAEQAGTEPQRLPFGVEDLPAAEAVTAPQFPNVAVSVVTEAGATSYARQSVPSTPVGNLTSGATIPIMVALLLPAIQQAREAARRTQSRNNLKQMGLALHNYHDVNQHFPQGTVANSDLQPDERLAWTYHLLPYLDENPLHDTLDADASWQNAWQGNPQPDLPALPVFQNPSMPRRGASGSSMDYVGIAGLGANAAELPLADPNAGMFGYDRKTRIRDVTDGLSNTLMITDAASPNASWLAGGRDTIRGFSQQPYINGPDGIGSPHRGGMQVLLGDGSVRFLSEDTDPQVIEAMATIHGGETVVIP